MSQLSSEARRSRPTSNVARQIPIVILYRQGEARCQRSVSERNRSQQSILRQAQANPFFAMYDKAINTRVITGTDRETNVASCSRIILIN